MMKGYICRYSWHSWHSCTPHTHSQYEERLLLHTLSRLPGQSSQSEWLCSTSSPHLLRNGQWF